MVKRNSTSNSAALAEMKLMPKQPWVRDCGLPPACALIQLGAMEYDENNAIQEKDLDALKHNWYLYIIAYFTRNLPK